MLLWSWLEFSGAPPTVQTQGGITVWCLCGWFGDQWEKQTRKREEWRTTAVEWARGGWGPQRQCWWKGLGLGHCLGHVSWSKRFPSLLGWLSCFCLTLRFYWQSWNTNLITPSSPDTAHTLNILPWPYLGFRLEIKLLNMVHPWAAAPTFLSCFVSPFSVSLCGAIFLS